MLPVENRPSSASEAKKRQADAPSVALVKRKHKDEDSTAAERPQGGADYFENQAVKVIRRAGEVTEIRKTEMNKSLQADVLGGKDMSKKSSDVKSRTLRLSLSWSSDTGRCVDASPVLLVHKGADEAKTTVFIGSHSHRMQALDLDTGRLLWERVLGGRIEASAAVSQCGRLVVIGQYQLSKYLEIF